MRQRTLLGTLVLAGTTAIAAGQTKEKTSEKADDLLAGPKVTEAPAAPQRKVVGGAADKLPEIAPRRWFQLARRLDLSIDQEDEVRQILRELMDARDAYQKKHGPKLRELRARMKATREAGQPPSREMREQMSVLLAEAPRAAAYQKRVWEILTPDQRAEMQASIDKIIEERRRRHAANGEQRAESTDRNGGELDERAKRRKRFLESRRRDAAGDRESGRSRD